MKFTAEELKDILAESDVQRLPQIINEQKKKYINTQTENNKYSFRATDKARQNYYQSLFNSLFTLDVGEDKILEIFKQSREDTPTEHLAEMLMEQSVLKKYHRVSSEIYNITTEGENFSSKCFVLACKCHYLLGEDKCTQFILEEMVKIDRKVYQRLDDPSWYQISQLLQLDNSNHIKNKIKNKMDITDSDKRGIINKLRKMLFLSNKEDHV
jgi:hypothetical protein